MYIVCRIFVVVSTGFRMLNPLRLVSAKLYRKLAVKILAGVRFTWKRERSLAVKPDVRLAPRGNPCALSTLENASKPLWNQAGRLPSGPETPSRGVHLLMYQPLSLVTPGMKFV